MYPSIQRLGASSPKNAHRQQLARRWGVAAEKVETCRAFSFLATSARDVALAREIDQVVREHGGLDSCMPDLNTEGRKDVLYFADGAVLARKQISSMGVSPGEWVLTDDPPEEGKELYSRQLTYWKSKLVLASGEYIGLRRDALESNPMLSCGSRLRILRNCLATHIIRT